MSSPQPWPALQLHVRHWSAIISRRLQYESLSRWSDHPVSRGSMQIAPRDLRGDDSRVDSFIALRGLGVTSAAGVPSSQQKCAWRKMAYDSRVDSFIALRGLGVTSAAVPSLISKNGCVAKDGLPSVHPPSVFLKRQCLFKKTKRNSLFSSRAGNHTKPPTQRERASSKT